MSVSAEQGQASRQTEAGPNCPESPGKRPRPDESETLEYRTQAGILLAVASLVVTGLAGVLWLLVWWLRA